MAASEILAKLEAFTEGAAGECLSDEEVLAFASGTLDAGRQVEAHFHLDQCEICQLLLSEAAHALATAVTAPTSDRGELSWHTTFQPGTLVGHRYLIVRFIARGGMGEVYEAFDRELQERVALKTVTSTACDDASAVRRLKAEVQLARRVSHANVCRIYDFGTHAMPETGSQISYLTMEFVEGETLGQRIRRCGAMRVEDARALGRQLLSGLRAAHEAGVLHRDFKSDNVMLRDEAGSACSALILDFGLARALDNGSHHHSSSNPNLLGTLGYIAPEQLQGRPHSMASDIYSLGIVWYEMLTGKLPFACESSPVGTALARLQGAAPAPSDKNPLVPSELDAVVLGCLRRSPKDRFQTAREALSTLDALEARPRNSIANGRLVPLLVAGLLVALAGYAAVNPAQRPPKPATQRDGPATPAPLPAEANPSSAALTLPPPVAAEPAVEQPSPQKQPRSNHNRTLRKTDPPPSPGPELEPSTQGLASSRPRVPTWEDPFDAGTRATSERAVDGGS